MKIIKGIYKCATKNKKQRNNESRDYSTSSSSSRDSDRSVQSERSSERSTSTISDISNRARRRSSIRNAGLSVQNNQRRSVMQVAAL